MSSERRLARRRFAERLERGEDPRGLTAGMPISWRTRPITSDVAEIAGGMMARFEAQRAAQEKRRQDLEDAAVLHQRKMEELQASPYGISGRYRLNKVSGEYEVLPEPEVKPRRTDVHQYIHGARTQPAPKPPAPLPAGVTALFTGQQAMAAFDAKLRALGGRVSVVGYDAEGHPNAYSVTEMGPSSMTELQRSAAQSIADQWAGLDPYSPTFEAEARDVAKNIGRVAAGMPSLTAAPGANPEDIRAAQQILLLGQAALNQHIRDHRMYAGAVQRNLSYGAPPAGEPAAESPQMTIPLAPAEGPSEDVQYLMQVHGLTQEQAEELIQQEQ